MNFQSKAVSVRASVTNTENSVNNTDVYNELLLQALNAISPSGGGTNSVTAETTAASGSTISGLVGVSFITDSTFTGFIAGATIAANTTVNITPEVGATLSAIAYIVTTGNITIVKLNRP